MGGPWQEKCHAARVKENETLGDMLVAPMKVCPDRVAIYFQDRAFTYRELDADINRVANALIALGVQPGDRVCTHLDNRPEFIAIYLGIMRAAAVLAPTNIMYTAEEIQHILNDSGAKILFTLPIVAEKVDKINVPSLEKVVELGERKRDASLSWDALLANQPTTRPDVTKDPATVALIQYTSGTTGVPKGAMVSDNNILAVIRNTTDLPSGVDPLEEDVVICVLPLFHSYALNLVIARTFLCAASMVLHARFDATAAFADIEKYKVTTFYGAPPMYHAFVNTPGLDQFDATSLRVAGSGAAPLPVVIMEQFKAITGVQISEGYGLSETAPTLSTNMAGPVNKPGAVGPPIKEVKLKIVDDDDNEVPQGDVGEICAQGPNIFLGYWNRPEATEEAMKGGWFHTGDMGRFDEDGYLYIVDRKKDMIVASGYNVYPIEIENVLLRHPKIKDCAVIGVADDYRGESVKACIVLHDGQTMEYSEMEAYCREHMAAFKLPKQMSIRSELPKNPTGKILKRVLREEEGGITKAST